MLSKLQSLITACRRAHILHGLRSRLSTLNHQAACITCHAPGDADKLFALMLEIFYTRTEIDNHNKGIAS